MNIHQSAEDYLESILVLKQQRGLVRSIDIVRHLDYSKPSVSRAMGLLRANGYIVIDKDGYIELTEQGMEIAARIYERHRLLTKWLEQLGVSSEIADRDACKIEHDISETTFEMLKKHIVKHTESDAEKNAKNMG